MTNLRSRLRYCKINCIPWGFYKGEIDYLPISAKTLFARRGIGIDILERELTEEGYLHPEESLIEVLKEERNLYRTTRREEEFSNVSFEDFPKNWKEEDYLYFFNSKNKHIEEIPF